ncbi:protease modulator HflC [Candidatus Laterigemmans baculatus]|uniref:protease modulator HflC n=1 Tax=Candidatus Laterigemmans baculatus TaxID=2770505 RepID=UPI0013DD10D9|nr:protease modulator HflC [Candidatus Laterigemmans baculatus]
MNNRILLNVLRGLAVLAVLLILMPFWVFIVSEREMAVVLRFGKPVREHTEPGVRFKVPFVETVRVLPKTQQFWGDSREYVLPDLPTRDDKKIELIPWSVWRITEPTVFVQRLRTIENAEQRVAQITRSAIRDVLTQYDLVEVVRSTNRPIPSSSDYSQAAAEAAAAVADDEIAARLAQAGEGQAALEIETGRRKILAEIKAEATRRLARQSDLEGDLGRGIELVDVGISQIDFVDTVRAKTFDRWIAEREAISARNVNEGERLKAQIINETKAEVQRIEGEGERIASETKGKADALAIQRYAEAINEVGEFYTFSRTLEAYENAISKDSRMILTTDSDFFDLLKKLQPPPEETGSR